MRFWGRIAIFVAIFLSLDVVVSWFAFCHPYDEATTQYQTQHEYCALGGPFIGVVSWGWSWIITVLHHRDKEIVAAFTVILTLSTVALWTATRDAASGGERAANIAEQALVKLERAFVYCEKIEWYFRGTKAPRAITHWVFQPHLRNGGSTRTKQGRNRVNSAGFSGDMPANFEFPDFGDGPDGSIMLAPKAMMHGLPVAIDIGTLRAIKAGQVHQYVWGWIDYNDIFDKTPRHRTEYCFEIIVQGDPADESCGFAFRYHERFNGADEECFRPPKQVEA